MDATRWTQVRRLLDSSQQSLEVFHFSFFRDEEEACRFQEDIYVCTHGAELCLSYKLKKFKLEILYALSLGSTLNKVSNSLSLDEISTALLNFPFLESMLINKGFGEKEIGVEKSMPEITANTCSRPLVEKKARPQNEQALNCPRCHSTNTKFCYYNNYSLTQPRYFCKTCRRYWTEGGTLRNVPVGGGSRKNKKSTFSPSSSSSSLLSTSVSSHDKLLDLNPPIIPHFSDQNPNRQDLNLAAPQEYYHGPIPHFLEYPKIENGNNINSSSSNPVSALDLLRTGIASKGLNSIFPTSNVETNALVPGFPVQECKPAAICFSFDGRLMFQRHSGTDEVSNQINKGHDNSNGYWNGMLGGGSW